MRIIRSLALVASFARLLVSGQNGDVCRPQDRTYSDETIPAGSFQPWDLFLNPVTNRASARFYVSIVNLTPHRFVLEHTHQYQMDTFSFGDIPQGRARQNAVKYRNRWATQDDAGEAYYRIDGTDQRFVVRLKGSAPLVENRKVILDLSGMNLGQREYKFPGGETSVTLVIAGSARWGLYASIRHDRGGWMRWIYDTIKDRPIRHLIMPGSHDAGMSRISNKILSIGTVFNTQTQGINIYDQLRAGSRWFDLRVASVHPAYDSGRYDGFWVLHVNNEMADVVVGNSGESLDDVINEINRFTGENPGEVIFFSVRYLVGRYQVPDRGPIVWTPGIMNDFFSKLRAINNRCANLDLGTGFQNQKASYFMDRNGGKGCVIFMLNGQNLREDVPKESLGDGIYAAGRMGVRDMWSDKMKVDALAPDQINGWRAMKRGGSGDYDQLYIAQWISTPDAVASTAVGLQAFAIQQTNPSLYWSGVNSISPDRFPNVILVDYIGVQQKDQTGWDQLSAEMYWLTIGLNLYTVSENCEISKRRSPVLRARGMGLRSRGSEKPWNGIIFANGTKIDNPPPDYHPGRIELLRNGTVFRNGTVLERTIPNPWV
ncbi:PI-PLC X domain-containing protein 1 [Cladorrhinum samala]|uniref:PI-PLC X domain-containing protein 1 n=1 Tax=Cladorrhinum samala TaxID=585594 RepID=A0AAV9HNK2_9PEZI|nr:PI-PLC X domain-containing protein 1 [Cladorrhinum samala]